MLRPADRVVDPVEQALRGLRGGQGRARRVLVLDRKLVAVHAGLRGSDDLVAKLKDHIRHEIGPIAVPAKIEFVSALPKTRSGKIMRRVLKAQATGQPVGDISTLED